MTSHLFKHSDDVTAFNLGERDVIKRCLMYYVSLRSSYADGQVLGQQNLATSHRKRVLDRVLQLSYVARPFMSHQNSHCLVREPARRLAMLLCELLQEVEDEERNIFTAVLQIRETHWHDVEAVK